MNSGAEGVETALKAARKWGYVRKGIAAGRRRDHRLRQQLPRAHGDDRQLLDRAAVPRRASGRSRPASASCRSVTPPALREAITPNTCAFLVEPIQGEAGIIVPPPGYLAEARRICREHDVLFIADEIQSGLGRTGALFACMHENVQPDVLILGKALSGGFYPVSAVLSSRRRARRLQARRPRQHVRRQPARLRHRARRARRARRRAPVRTRRRARPVLPRSAPRDPHAGRARGPRQGACGSAWSWIARRGPFCERLKDEGVLCKETHERVIRFAPPLVITRRADRLGGGARRACAACDA